MSTLGKLCAFEHGDYTILMDEAKKNADRFTDVNLKVISGERVGIIRFKLGGILKKSVAEVVSKFFVMVAANGYRIVGKNFGQEGSLVFSSLDLKVGGKDGRAKKGYTLVAVASAFPDVGGQMALAMKEQIKALVVGKWFFDPKDGQYPLALYFNGSHTMVVDDSQTEAEKNLIALAVLAMQGCYICSRALAGTKTVNVSKISPARIAQLKYIEGSGNAWPLEDKKKALALLLIPNAAATLMAIGKSLPAVDVWPTGAKDFLEAVGKLIGWVHKP